MVVQPNHDDAMVSCLCQEVDGTSDSMRLLSWLGCDEIVILVGMFDAFGAGDEDDDEDDGNDDVMMIMRYEDDVDGDDDDYSVLADLNEPLHIRCLQ